MKPRVLAAVALVLVAAAGGQATAQQADRSAIRATSAIDTVLLRDVTRTLAHDSLRGRDTGSPGASSAARTIAERLSTLGLRPSTADGTFTQRVPIVAESVDPGSSLALLSGPDSAVFMAGADFILLPPNPFEARAFEGEAWFLGMGDGASEAIEPGAVRGRVLVALGGLPESADSLLGQWTRNGAAAVVLIVPDSLAYAGAQRDMGAPVLSVPGTGTPLRPAPPLPVIIAGPRLGQALLEGVTVQPRLADRPFRAVALPRTISASFAVLREPVAGVNVVARLDGTDPALRDELIVFTAHYDHVGVGLPDETGDSIRNGFSDNAAGVAMLLAIADAMRREPPARSVVFLFLTGEERGLLGSSFAAAEPPWPGGLTAVKALINLDGGAPPRPPVSWRIAGGLDGDGRRTPIGALADSIAAESGWVTRLEAARPNSDYWPFAERGVPSIFIIPGNEWEGTTPEERDALRTRWDRYHQPGDEYHEDFPFTGIRRYAGLALAIGYAAATSSLSPRS